MNTVLPMQNLGLGIDHMGGLFAERKCAIVLDQGRMLRASAMHIVRRFKSWNIACFAKSVFENRSVHEEVFTIGIIFRYCISSYTVKMGKNSHRHLMKSIWRSFP
jgi:hypothetical protein